MKQITLSLSLIAFIFIISSCSKSYTCACDADGVAPIQNDYTYEIEANSKDEAREKCQQFGDECGLYPL